MMYACNVTTVNFGRDVMMIIIMLGSILSWLLTDLTILPLPVFFIRCFNFSAWLFYNTVIVCHVGCWRLGIILQMPITKGFHNIHIKSEVVKGVVMWLHNILYLLPTLPTATTSGQPRLSEKNQISYYPFLKKLIKKGFIHNFEERAVLGCCCVLTALIWFSLIGSDCKVATVNFEYQINIDNDCTSLLQIY